jgi:MSHA biogenesis protein MshP
MFLDNSYNSLKVARKIKFGQKKDRQSGSALVIAIFVIIVLSLLGAALVKILDSSQESVAFEVLGTRAYNAAQTGIQWQLAQLFSLDGSIKMCSEISNIPPDISAVSGFEGCEIQLTVGSCVDFLHDSSRYYTITSTGQCSVGAEVTSRTLEVEARSL